MSGIINPPKIVVQTLEINNFIYALFNLIPHTSVEYRINCFSNEYLVKTIFGLLDGEQYKEWTTDDWMDRFIRQKIEELPVVEVNEPLPESLPEPLPEPVPEPPVEV